MTPRRTKSKNWSLDSTINAPCSVVSPKRTPSPSPRLNSATWTLQPTKGGLDVGFDFRHPSATSAAAVRTAAAPQEPAAQEPAAAAQETVAAVEEPAAEETVAAVGEPAAEETAAAAEETADIVE
jgi:nucleotide-binding universal stress UspA family protein